MDAVLWWLGWITLAEIALVVGAVAYWFVRETIRSFRQTCRIARVVYGQDWLSKGRKNPSRFLRQWRREFGSRYDSLVFGGVELPWNAVDPIKHRYPG